MYTRKTEFAKHVDCLEKRSAPQNVVCFLPFKMYSLQPTRLPPTPMCSAFNKVHFRQLENLVSSARPCTHNITFCMPLAKYSLVYSRLLFFLKT